MPMMSPVRRAGGLTRSTWDGEGMKLEQEFSATDELRRTAKKNLVFPTHRLRTSRSVHAYRRLSTFGKDRRYRSRTRARAGRLCFAYSALVKTNLYVASIS